MGNVFFAGRVFLQSFAVAVCLVFPALAQGNGGKTTFDRVMESGKIRCGYASWAPSLMIDPNTGALSGYSYDVMNAVGEKLGLEVEWAEEAGWGVAEQGIESGRYDAFCVDVCMEPHRTKVVWYSAPFIYLPFYAIVRADDNRFDANRDSLDSESVTFAIIPNTLLDYAVRDVFPDSKRVDVNDLAGDGNVMMTVVGGKADSALSTYYPVTRFNENNDKKVKTVGEPVRTCPAGFLLPRRDTELKYVVDSAITQLRLSGRLEEIFQRYAPNDGRYWLLPTLPYQNHDPVH
ncbi:MAG: transporter substrate-binding domain-containing protein [Alphaproteobacteria bacterium]|nr:transporter substrate-binding domain-containing protein [Alphaproteobacteria bacterium]